MTMTDPEDTGDHYSVATLLDVRDRTRAALHAIASQVAPGMAETEAVTLARETLADLGLRRGWHRTLVRCGPNTTKSFSERSDEGVVLGDHDIFFVDIGPVHAGTEGDAGETFVLGDDPDHHRARVDVRAVWDEVRDVWSQRRLSGRALYERAAAAAEARGWQLNLDLAGHRLSDFPHAAHYDGTLAEVDIVPAPDLWVLEIAIRHPDRPFGAFYEDLLVGDGAR